MINLTAILNDLMGAAIVVAALVAAAVIIKLIASVVGKAKHEAEDEEASEPASAPSVCTKSELKLVDVDERTAALIMAIVSHESGIPLSELVFSSIKLV
jgi:Na+-transporting methylmalonyl-CoA/oxaloacetate decarboxylase gamma subunit